MIEIVKNIPKPDTSEDVLYYTRQLAFNLRNLSTFWERMNSNESLILPVLRANLALVSAYPDLFVKIETEIDRYTSGKKLEHLPSALSNLLDAANNNIEVFQNNKVKYNSFNFSNFLLLQRQKIENEINTIKAEVERNNQNQDAGTEELTFLVNESQVKINRLRAKLEALEEYGGEQLFDVIHTQNVKVRNLISQWQAPSDVEIIEKQAVEVDKVINNKPAVGILDTDKLKGLIKEKRIKDFMAVLEESYIIEEDKCILNKKEAFVILALSEALKPMPKYLEKDFTRTEIYTRLAKFLGISAGHPKKNAKGYTEKLGEIKNSLMLMLRLENKI